MTQAKEQAQLMAQHLGAGNSVLVPEHLSLQAVRFGMSTKTGSWDTWVPTKWSEVWPEMDSEEGKAICLD